MRRCLFIVMTCISLHGNREVFGSGKQEESIVRSIQLLPELAGRTKTSRQSDWLVNSDQGKSGVYRTGKPLEIVLTNGLISRTFRLSPNAATVAFDNLMTGASMVRAVEPEARVRINGKQWDIGGLVGQIERAYLLPKWIDSLTSDPQSLQFSSFEVGQTRERFPWKPKRWSANLPWPPPGVSLTLNFETPRADTPRVNVAVHYEMYDGIPLLAKWISVSNLHSRSVRLNSFTNEILAAVEQQSSVGGSLQELPKPQYLYVESEYAFNGSMEAGLSDRTVHWRADTSYTSQVNYGLQTPCLLEVKPDIGPDVEMRPQETFVGFRTFELVYDSYDRERRGMAKRRMCRTLAPWATENPIFLHLTSTDPEVVKRAVDQCVATGFEMIILSFGSGLDMEDESPANIEKFRSLAGYAHSKGIEIGGYSLLASRRITDSDDVINPATGTTGGAIFGNSPCLGSRWGQKYFRKLKSFYQQTGFDVLEHDGSYPGDVCASTIHPGHAGLNDSQWKQWKIITDFYHWCRSRDIYLNVPDWYFMNGSNKTGIGYREVNWSLPRDRQIVLGRQNIFDGTWEKAPSMGWTFVPLVEYQGGGAVATLEPLSQHLKEYESHLAQNFGSGVQACYRGPRIYDTDETKTLVKKWVDLYKRYRDILNSDIVHVRRADGEDLDCMLHVNPRLKERGFAFVYNPTDETIRKSIILPLDLAGLTGSVLIREKEETPRRFEVDRKSEVELPVEVPAKSYTWFTIEQQAR
ncbi:MAG: alpha-galactosidase [Bacteroidota bacterium]